MSHQAGKRSACDRCRGQKLRCPQTEQQQKDGDPCSRCERAGAVCTTSSARPPGRPRTVQPGKHGRPTVGEALSPAGLDHGRRISGLPGTPPAGLDQGLTSDGLSASPPPRKAPRLSATPCTSEARASDVTVDLYGDSATISDASCNRGLSWMLNDASNLLDDFQLPDDGAIFDPLSSFHAAQIAFAPTFPHSVVAGNPYGGREEHALDDPKEASRNGSNLVSDWRISADDALIALAKLNESIARQLSRAKTFTWRAPPLQRECGETSERNGVAEALHSTSDFIGTLRGLTAPTSAPAVSHNTPSLPDSGISVSASVNEEQLHGSPLSIPGASPPATVAAPSAASPLSTPTVLLLLSSHLQLLQLYDAIFRQVHDMFRAMPDSALRSCPSQGQSEFRVAGLAPIDGHLHVKILVQVIEYHLDMLEELIGLPSEFRLSGRTASSEGVLSNLNVSALVQVAMTGIDGEYPSISGKSLVTSLRDGIHSLKQVL